MSTARQTIVLSSGQQVGLATYGADDGFPILALHGAPACRLMFDVADANACKAGLKLYCPDRPGYGLTPSLAPVTLAARVAFLANVVEKLGLKRFGMLGISGGGPYAAALAAHFGQRVAVLGLVSPVGPIADYDARSLPTTNKLHKGHRIFFLKCPKHPIVLRAISLLARRLFLIAPQAFAAMFAKTLPKADRDDLAAPAVVESVIGMTKEALCQGVDGGLADLKIYSKPWGIDFNQITSPTFVWQGMSDKIVPAPVAIYLSDQIQGAQLFRLPEAGHFWIYSHIDEMFATLRHAISASTRD
ncbi:MAG: alpha/beta fold hydrolase [Hyphomicrobiaceae bacterium]